MGVSIKELEKAIINDQKLYQSIINHYPDHYFYIEVTVKEAKIVKMKLISDELEDSTRIKVNQIPVHIDFKYL